jgi:hypothetical protein
MKQSKKYFLVLINIIFFNFTSSQVFATETCVQCGGTTVSGMPSVDSNLMKIAGAAAAVDRYSFEDRLSDFCLEYIQIERTQLAGFIKRLETKTAYSVDDFLQKAGCPPEGYGGNIKSPMFHLVADHPNKQEDYLQLFYKYYTIKRKNLDLWLAAINAKNTKGETLLDYIEFKRSQGNYPNEVTTKTVEGLIAFACSKGAVYSKLNKECPK